MSARISITLALILCTTLACGNDAGEPPQGGNQDRRVLIVSAFDGELEPLLEATTSVKVVRRGGRVYYTGVLAGEPVVLALTGVGVRRAHDATEAAAEAFDPSAIVFVGVAGGIDPAVGVGDVLVPAEWGQHDRSATPTWFAADARLRSLVPTQLQLEACKAAPCARAPRVHRDGRGVSGAEFIADPEHAKRLWSQHGARVVDMETSAVAEVAAARRIPFLGFRAVSDVVTTGNSRQDIERYWSLAAANASRAAVAFIERL